MSEDHRVADAVMRSLTADELAELADRIADRKPMYLGAFPLIDPPLLRLRERDAIVAALRLAAAQNR